MPDHVTPSKAVFGVPDQTNMFIIPIYIYIVNMHIYIYCKYVYIYTTQLSILWCIRTCSISVYIYIYVYIQDKSILHLDPNKHTSTRLVEMYSVNLGVSWMAFAQNCGPYTILAVFWATYSSCCCFLQSFWNPYSKNCWHRPNQLLFCLYEQSLP